MADFVDNYLELVEEYFYAFYLERIPQNNFIYSVRIPRNHIDIILCILI